MLYSAEFLEGIKHDPIAGVRVACNMVLEKMNPSFQDWTFEEEEALLEADILFTELTDAGMMPFDYIPLPVSKEAPKGEKLRAIRQAIDEVLQQWQRLEDLSQRERLVSRIRIGIGTKFAYEFLQGDIARIQALLNELRTLVSANDKFKPEHQQRLLARLEALQRELHKKVSDLDRFWGLIGDAGVMLCKAW